MPGRIVSPRRDEARVDLRSRPQHVRHKPTTDAPRHHAVPHAPFRMARINVNSRTHLPCLAPTAAPRDRAGAPRTVPLAAAALIVAAAGMSAHACELPTIHALPGRIMGAQVSLSWDGAADSYLLHMEARTPNGAIIQSEQLATTDRYYRLQPRPAAAGAKISVDVEARCADGTSSAPAHIEWFVPGSTWCRPVTGLRRDSATAMLRWDNDGAGPYRVYIEHAATSWASPVDTALAGIELSGPRAAARAIAVSRQCPGGESQPVVLMMR